MIKWIVWFIKDWRKNWLYILVALLICVGAFVLESLGWSSEIRDWIACKNPDEMKRSLDCWKK